MTPRNRSYWTLHQAAYPFHAECPTMEPTPSDVARTFDPDAIGNFIAVPAGDGQTWWGFETELGRAAFIATFVKATELTP